MDTNGLLDKKNIELWNTLKNKCEIEIIKEKRIDYLSYSENNKTIIYVPYNNLNPSSFTHELLHVYLRTKEVFIASGFMLSIKGSQILSRILSKDLIKHVSNCIDHILMFPEFIKLGYNKNEFIVDYSINKLNNEDTKYIKECFTRSIFFKKIYSSKVIDLFIGKYFAANACPNESFSYVEQLNKLKEVNLDLFQVLETFLTALKRFDYNDTDPISGNYHLFLYELIDNLENWTIDKYIR